MFRFGGSLQGISWVGPQKFKGDGSLQPALTTTAKPVDWLSIDRVLRRLWG